MDLLLLENADLQIVDTANYFLYPTFQKFGEASKEQTVKDMRPSFVQI